MGMLTHRLSEKANLNVWYIFLLMCFTSGYIKIIEKKSNYHIMQLKKWNNNTTKYYVKLCNTTLFFIRNVSMHGYVFYFYVSC